MSEHSRRSFLKQASIGAAVAGAATVIPASAASAATASDTDAGPAHDGPFAVWVTNAKTGELTVMVGESEIVHHDRALARKLARVAARGAKS